MKRLTGRVAIVTGAARGIGAATASRLASEGATVVVTDIDDPAGVETADALVMAGYLAVFRHLDVSSESDWHAAVNETVDRQGGLDILVNNAGIHGEPTSIEDTSVAE
ncbi:MAG: SDR family NAD(P)-dependent oxidoreductase [Trebonia sp.]